MPSQMEEISDEIRDIGKRLSVMKGETREFSGEVFGVIDGIINKIKTIGRAKLPISELRKTAKPSVQCKCKKIDTPNGWDVESDVARAHDVSMSISIAQLLDSVKDVFDDTLSEDVYRHFAMESTDSKFLKELNIKCKKADFVHGWFDDKSSPRATRRPLKISIAQLLDSVKDVFDDTLSEDVYRHFAMERPNSKFLKE